ncbi:pyruvate dehydrogenase E2 component (dihydrolipoamide acetyltransferase) [Arcicella aurantiaca]|uniref:Dihydrolipoamide acetyltransferase component of pyruvate dehydrogenase complex n=2 Tax=Arcicella aurantiaca TaxID=591202 RepID=A0A316EB82_9BACT|nr:pyruvate dehydrogenase E2 component (dihydrolipoamide acetyltransferase) [Arcicella aurantiaca]
MSDTMTEGVVAEWLKKVGDVLKPGDGLLAEIETDKATMELDLDERMDLSNFKDCRLLYIGLEKGKAVPVDSIIAIIGENGEAFEHLIGGGSATSAPAPAAVETPAAAPAPVASTPAVDTSSIKAEIIGMPKMSDTMEEGTLVAWVKKVGDVIKPGDTLLAEIETDKATMEFELDNFLDVTKYNPCTLLYIGIEAGKTVAVDQVIAIIGEPGADFQALLSGGTPAAAPVAAPAPVQAAAAPAPAVEAVAVSDADGRVKASPLAKALAKDKGINIAQVKGTGENGRIVKADIDNFVPAAKSAEAPTKAASSSVPAVSGVESFEEIPLTQMRKAIARSLADSQSTAVDFQLTMEICMDKAMQAREVMNSASPVKISFNDMILKACGVALKKHPNVNSSWREDHIRRNSHVHIGMAVAIAEGLVVPVIRFADTLPLSVLAATTKDLGGKAKNGKLQPKDWEGNTFTVSNLGMFGIEQFTSIINNPKNESCILSVGGIKETVAVKNGQFYATNIMKITLTCDHRVVDGASGAAFLVSLKELLEEPYKLLV